MAKKTAKVDNRYYRLDFIKEAVDIAKVGSKVLGDQAGQAVGKIAGQAGGALNVFSSASNLFSEESSDASKVGSAMQLASFIPGVGQIVGGVGTAIQLADAFFGKGDSAMDSADDYIDTGGVEQDEYAALGVEHRAAKRENLRRKMRTWENI